MESHFLPYRNSKIHYLKFGSGTRFLFCFHGYGETAESFLFLQRSLGADFTLIAPDMPFHGKTQWNEGLEFTPADLEQIINSIVPLELQTISLLGYSMGGRISLAMLQQIPSKIERVVLVAPDGLHKNFWYWVSTQTRLGNALFSYAMRQPKSIFVLMSFLTRFGLLNKSIVKFVHAYLDDNEERMLLYNRWTTMRKFNPRHERILAVLKQYSVPIRMLFGRYDRIILSKRSAGLRQNSNVKIKTIHAGHQLLKEKYAKDIAILFYE